MTINLNKIISDIKYLGSRLPSRINLMEVCGTHTMAIGKNGIRQLLPENINLISGPGCPVCVTAINEIDQIIELSAFKDIVIFTFGDMLKVPGSETTLLRQRSSGSSIKMCYSPNEALQYAIENPEKNIVFLAIGFETTAPLTASVVKNAAKNNIKNFFIYNLHKTVPAAIFFLLDKDEKLNLDAFLCPGHVCAVTGSRPFEFISEKFKKPAVISGFTPEDILKSILMILKQLSANVPETEIQYTLAVKKEGNIFAKNLISEVFDSRPASWRGIGIIEDSGLSLKSSYESFDAKKVFEINTMEAREPKYCECGRILLGEKKPFDCRLFASGCTPENPVGPCMVSSEGTCAAYYKYERMNMK